MHFVDNEKCAYEDKDGVRIEVWDMISISSGCPELICGTRTVTMFCLRCL